MPNSPQDSPALRVLIIEPSPEFALSLENRLQGLRSGAFKRSTAATVSEAWEALALESFDLILAGLPLPSPPGADLGELAAGISHLPVVGVSDSGSTHFLHPSLGGNVTIVLPRVRAWTTTCWSRPSAPPSTRPGYAAGWASPRRRCSPRTSASRTSSSTTPTASWWWT